MQAKGLIESKAAVGRGPTIITLKGGLKLQTFDHESVFPVKNGAFCAFNYHVEETQSKDGSRTFKNNVIDDWEEVEGTAEEKAVSVPDKPVVDPAVWDAKDRAVYMESAYKTAAEYFKSVEADKVNAKDLQRLAHTIYKDILKAKDNVAFVSE